MAHLGLAMRDDSWKPSANAAMDRYACGDEAAFEELYDLLAPRLHAFLFRRASEETVQDLLQQTFLQMHAARTHFVPGSDVTPWAFAITRRLLIDGFRRADRYLATGSDAATASDRPTPDPSSAGLVGKRRLLRRVEEELEHVSPTNRIAFELVRLDGVGLEEAAQMLGTTVMGVKLRVHRALQALQERLGPDVREELSEWA